MMATNRVKELVEFWGEEKGLGIALFHYSEANSRGKEKWLREFREYRDGANRPATEPASTEFTPEDVIRARGIGVRLDVEPAKVLSFAARHRS
jgi:hypothetical protein